MKGNVIFAFLLGAAVGGTVTFYYANKKMVETVEANSELSKAYYKELYEKPSAKEAAQENEETSNEEPEEEDIQEVEPMPEFETTVLKEDSDIEGYQKPSLFDYAKISLSTKPKQEKPPNTEEQTKEEPFRMRKVSAEEYEELAYSYETIDLTVYQDGYVTDLKDAKVMMLDEMYEGASLSDADKDGTIYVAADYAMTVYTINVDPKRYEDIYDLDEDD